MNIKQKLIALASKELTKKEFGATEQFLEIHSIAKEDRNFKIANVIINEEDAQIFTM